MEGGCTALRPSKSMSSVLPAKAAVHDVMPGARVFDAEWARYLVMVIRDYYILLDLTPNALLMLFCFRYIFQN